MFGWNMVIPRFQVQIRINKPAFVSRYGVRLGKWSIAIKIGPLSN